MEAEERNGGAMEGNLKRSSKRRKGNKWTAMLLLFVILAYTLCGCSKTSVSQSDQNGEETNGGSKTEEGASSSDSEAMGRYVENVLDLEDMLVSYGSKGIYRLTDGRILISDTYSPFLISEDNGHSWREDSRQWLTDRLEKGVYIMSMAVGKDNTAAFIYHDDGTDSEAAEETAADEEETLEDYTLNPRLVIVKPDGTEIPVDIATTQEDAYLYQVYFSDDGRIFVTTMGSGNIYEAKEDGSSELFLTLDTGRPELIQVQNQLMIIDAYDSVLLYDMEKGEYIEDEVLTDFIDSNYNSRRNQAGSWYDMYFFFGEEDVLYLAGVKGLHRHVIGGSAVEQVIDGSLCSFNNPAYGIMGMTALDNNEFMTLFGGGRLVRFTYDPDIPTIPNEKLKVYSLKDNSTIRQAITLFQSANPEVFVEYEIGMEENSSLTREDALKSLNTKIMAGDGPDVLVLDDMPLTSYMEKGLLLDLTGVISGLSGEEALFDNIVQAAKTEDKIYAIPLEVQIPMLLGDKERISQMTDLKGIADGVEALRKEHPAKDLLDICSEKGIMRMFSMVSVPSWTSDKGEIDREAIQEFLVQAKRIYDAQMDGIDDKQVEEYQEINEYYLSELGYSRDDSDYFRESLEPISYVGELSYLECGALTSAYGYANVISAEKKAGFENSGWTVMNGQSSDVLCAQTLLGISTAAKNSERAQEFLKVCLSKENQSYLFKGFPVNQAAFDECFVPDEDILGENGEYGVYCLSNDEGLYIELNIYWPSKEQITRLKGVMEAADTIYIKDDILEEAVYEEGVLYMQGSQGLEETIANIEKKISIYMAE